MGRQQLVHRRRVPAQGGWDQEAEGRLRQGLGPALETVQHRTGGTQGPVRAPVGVGDGDVRHAGLAGAGRQRQAKVPHHHVGPNLADQAEVLLIVGLQAVAAEDRHGPRKPLGEHLRGLRGQREGLHAANRPGVVALRRRQIDVVAMLGQAGCEGQGPGHVGEGGAFADEQHAQLLGPRRGVSPGGCGGRGAWA